MAYAWQTHGKRMCLDAWHNPGLKAEQCLDACAGSDGESVDVAGGAGPCFGEAPGAAATCASASRPSQRCRPCHATVSVAGGAGPGFGAEASGEGAISEGTPAFRPGCRGRSCPRHAIVLAVAVAAPGPRRGCRSWWAGRACEADGSAGKLTATSCEEAPSGGAWATLGGAGAAGGSGAAGAEAASRRGRARVVQTTLRCSCPEAEL